jgi:hypothetical protein
MNRGNMAKQIMESPMKKKGYMGGGKVKAAKKGYKCGGTAKKGYAKGGMVDQSMCSPRKQMAMGKG